MKPKDIISSKKEVDMKKSGIYMIYCAANDKAYIGQTSQSITRRITEHKSDLKYSRHRNIHLQRCWDKYGIESFNFIGLENCDKEALTDREIFYALQIDSDCRLNLSAITEHFPVSQETRDKISKALKGRVLSSDWKRKIGESGKGKHNHSNEVREVISKAHKGKKLSKEHKKKLSWAGRKHSEETKMKMSLSQKGKCNRWKNHKKEEVILGPKL